MKKLILGLLFFAISSHAQHIIPGPGGSVNYKTTVANIGALPVVGNTPGDARVVLSASTIYVWDGAVWNSVAGAGSIVWGSITGTLSNQIDLQTALNLKLNSALNSSHLFVGNAGNLATDVAASGDLTLANTGAFTFNTVNGAPGSFGNAANTCTLTVNAKGLVTSASQTGIQIAESQVTNLVADLAAKQSTTLTNTHLLVGNGSNVAADVAASGDLSLANTGAFTLSTVNGSPGSYTNASVTVNGKGLVTAASSGAVGNLTGLGISVTGGSNAVLGAGTSITLPSQHDIWVDRNGIDAVGCGILSYPCQTVGYSLGLVTAPSSTNNWSIHLMSGRHDQEVSDLLLPPYVWIVGSGGPDVGSYLRLPAGKAIKLAASWVGVNGRGGIQSVYLGGGTSVNLDFAGAIGGANGSNFMFDDCFVTGTFSQTGRGFNGGDFLYIQNTFIFGASTFDGSELQSINSTWGGSVSANASTVQSDLDFIGGQVSGAFAFTESAAQVANMTSSGTAYISTFTTTGTIALTTDDHLPVGFTLSGGTTVINLNDAKSLAYNPTTSANWNTVPTRSGPALDTLASSGIVKSQAQNLILASPNGSSGLPSFRALVAADIPLTFVAPLVNTAGSVQINGSVKDDHLNFVNAADATKAFTFDLSQMTTGTTDIFQPLTTQNETLKIQPLVDSTANFLMQNATSGQVFIGANATIGGSNAGIQYSDASTANRGQIKLHSYFNGASIAGVSTLTSRSGAVGTNAAVVAGQDYSKWTAQAGATTAGSAPISGTFAFKANTVNLLTVTSDFHVALTNLAGTLGDRLYLGSEGALQLPNYSTGLAHFDASGNITSSLLATADIGTNVVTNTNLAQIPAHSYKGNNTGSTANAADITSTQLTADLNLFTSVLQGLVPASGGGTANFLRADGTFAAPSGTIPAAQNISGNTTLVSTSHFYFGNTSGGSFNATFPAASSNSGAQFCVKNITFGGGNLVNLVRTGADLFEGATSDSVAAGEQKCYASDGVSNWYLAN